MTQQQKATAHFTAVSADKTVVNIEFDAELAAGVTTDNAAEEAAEVLEEYMRKLVLETTNASDIVIRLASVLDYSNLKINGNTENIVPGEDNVPIVGEVTVNVL